MRQLWQFCILFGSNFGAMRKYGDTTITQFDSFPPNLKVNIYGKSAKYRGAELYCGKKQTEI